MTSNDSKKKRSGGDERDEALKRLLEGETASSQEELRDQLERKGFEVTQSTISRSLRKLGAVRAIDSSGGAVYRLPVGEEIPPRVDSSLRELIVEITHNESMIVVHTSPGTASLVARFLDLHRPGKILGTIAGDDTVFVAPASTKEIRQTIAEIRKSLVPRS